MAEARNEYLKMMYLDQKQKRKSADKDGGKTHTAYQRLLYSSIWSGYN